MADSEFHPEAIAQWRPTAAKAQLEARAAALADVRQFFAQRQVLEVQTPLLGAATVTDPAIDALAVSSVGAGDSSASPVGFLQTSTEYHQKRLLAAGVGDNYTLGPVFRSDEQGRLHNPEFTMLEWYRVGFDDQRLMGELAELVDLLLGPGDYHTNTYAALMASVPPGDFPDLQLAEALGALGEGRHFVVGYPAHAAVLARLDVQDPRIARRFELVINGIEVANGYFELTDATAHRQRFAADNQLRHERGRPEVAVDQALLGAVEAGLPDCAGVAVGFDRLLMLRLGMASIEDVQAFSWLRR